MTVVQFSTHTHTLAGAELGQSMHRYARFIIQVLLLQPGGMECIIIECVQQRKKNIIRFMIDNNEFLTHTHPIKQTRTPPHCVVSFFCLFVFLCVAQQQYYYYYYHNNTKKNFF